MNFGDEDGPFDLGQLSLAIEAKRLDLELSWAELSAQVGVATSTIRRFAHAQDAEADGALCLIEWLGVAPESFVPASKSVGVRLPDANGGVVRVDMAEISKLSEFSYGSKRRSRTTIQRLVTAAQGAGLPVAALTKRSQF